jgi:hypothetical protein
MLDFLRSVGQRVPLAVVGGSDLEKIFEQLGADGGATNCDGKTGQDRVLAMFDFLFSENGLVGFHGTEALPMAVSEWQKIHIICK